MTSPDASDTGFILEAREVVKDFPGVRALDRVSFGVRPGEVHALVGENGAGKSTLIKILSGVHPSYSFEGEILIDGKPAAFNGPKDAENAGIAVIHQELALVESMSVMENIFLGREPKRRLTIDRARMNVEAAELLERVGARMDPETPVAALGMGKKQMVEIAKALGKNSRVLVLDEPTAALSDKDTELLLALVKTLRDRGKAIIYISHKLDEVFSAADRVTVLRDGATVDSRPCPQWNRAGLVKAMVGREVNDMYPRVEREIGDTMFEVSGLTLHDPEIPGRKMLDNVSFDVKQGEILGISGLVGAGRTELLMTLFGAAPGVWEGAVKVRGEEVSIRTPKDAIKAGLALLPEDRKSSGLIPIFSVLHNLSMVHLADFAKAGIIDQAALRVASSKSATEFAIKTPSLDTPAESLSGGNQQKVVLGKWLMRTPKVLFLDEPTRGIDVGAKAEIHRMIGNLAACGMAVVIVSSDLPEVLGVADRVITLKEGVKSGEFPRSEATPEKVMERCI